MPTILDQDKPMIEVYAFATPNSLRVPILLEALGLPYDLRSVNVRKGEQRLPEQLPRGHG